MQNRLSTYPGRIRLIPVEGQENVFDVERADEPSQLGTELKKETLLSDETAAALGLSDDATPDTAFAKIKTLMDILDTKIIECVEGSYVGTGTYGVSNPNTLTFSFAPKIILFAGEAGTKDTLITPFYVLVSGLTTSYKSVFYNSNYGRLYMKRSNDGKIISWYNPENAYGQMNSGLNGGETYRYLAIG